MRNMNMGRQPRQPQAGFQKIDKDKKATIWQLTKFVLANYRFHVGAVLI